MKNRLTRINDELQRELSNIIRMDVKDPRICTMTSVIRVETTQDLKFCKVFVSVLGTDEDKENVMKGLKNANGFIRHLIAERVNLRITPQLIFKLDDSVEYAVKMSKLIDDVINGLPKEDGDINE